MQDRKGIESIVRGRGQDPAIVDFEDCRIAIAGVGERAEVFDDKRLPRNALGIGLRRFRRDRSPRVVIPGKLSEEGRVIGLLATREPVAAWFASPFAHDKVGRLAVSGRFNVERKGRRHGLHW